MIRRVSDLYGLEVHASDDYLGRITDCYLDGAEWVLRYFVVDISDVILDRLVLVAPHAVRSIDWDNRTCRIAPSREEVEGSPELEVDQPVSRQYEMALHRHYEWPEYWGQSALMDTPRAKRMPQPSAPDEADEESRLAVESDEEYEGDAIGPPEARETEPEDEEMLEMDFGESTLEGKYDTDLRSCTELGGYAVAAADGVAGNVKELLFEDDGYLVRFVVVGTAYHANGKVVLVPEEWVKTVSWGEKTLHVDMTRKAVVGLPEFRPGMPVTREVERKLYDYVDQL
jgi:hypothetical protein